MPRLSQKEKRTREFVGFCKRHRLAMDQAITAREKGHPKLADGILRQAQQILIQIEQHVREDQYQALVKGRTALVQKLQVALTKGRTNEARQLAQDLAALDKSIEAV